MEDTMKCSMLLWHLPGVAEFCVNILEDSLQLASSPWSSFIPDDLHSVHSMK